MKRFKKAAQALVVSIMLMGCSDDSSPGIGTVTLQFSNDVETQALVLNSGTYTNSSNESYSVSELKYILSDIVLIDAAGNEFVYPKAESYFLVNEAETVSKTITLDNIPGKDYTSIRFGFGVDQSNYPLNGVANFVPKAEEQGMLWSWSAGYIFMKIEGNYTPQGGAASTFRYHVGSHGTTLDNYKTITLALPQAVSVVNEGNVVIAIKADIAKVFDSTNTMSLEVADDVQVDPVNAPLISTNIATMFSVTQINNQ